MDNFGKVSLTPSEVMEYLYCPRFIYYMSYLRIPQHEKNSFKVMMGRTMHERKLKINKEYLRKKIGVKEKILDQKMFSEKYNIHGIVDEILFLNDGTAAPLDYKFAKYQQRLFLTHKIQAAMYALMIADSYRIEVNRAYIVYIRSKNLLKEIKLNKVDFDNVKQILSEIISIIQKGYYPDRTKYRRRCFDCTYRNICIH